jgi:hypothetical protein
MFSRLSIHRRLALGFTLTVLVAGISANVVSAATTTFSFHMVPSAGAKACIPRAIAAVSIHSLGPVETLDVSASGLPAHTDFDLFVIQVPTAPFGVSWYQGDLQTDGSGRATGHFVGRFSIETFAVAPGVAPAPNVHNSGPFKDATSNPAFAPVHTYHLGLWFNSPADAAKAGCASTVTPFNGDHNAGIQALNTAQFAVTVGPLKFIRP